MLATLGGHFAFNEAPMKRTRTLKAYDVHTGDVLRLDNGQAYVVRAIEGTTLEDACCTDEVAMYVTLLSMYYSFPDTRLSFSFILRLPRTATVRCDS
jgi:hypothetical protein